MSRRGSRLYHTTGNRDRNERPIIEALEAQGFCVSQLQGRGVPDLLVAKGASVWLVEIKQPKAKYTPAQVVWRQRWTGPAPITLRSLEDAQLFCVLACEAGPSEASAALVAMDELQRLRLLLAEMEKHKGKRTCVTVEIEPAPRGFRLIVTAPTEAREQALAELLGNEVMTLAGGALKFAKAALEQASSSEAGPSMDRGIPSPPGDEM